MHPDKYRLLHTRSGADFVGFVVRRDGRIRVRAATARRYQAKFWAMRWEVGQGRLPPVNLTTSGRAWVAHNKTRAKFGSTSSGVEPQTIGRGIGIKGSSNRNDNNPANVNNNNGFRVTSPGTVCGGSRLFGPESLGSSKRLQRPCPHRDYPILQRAGGLVGGRITWCAVVVSSLGERRHRTAFVKVAWAS